MARLESTYGKGKWCADPKKPDSCLNIDDVTKVMATSRDPKRLREVWEGWHTIAPPMKKDYTRFVELSNKGARSSASRTPAPCGARSTTCRPTITRRNWTACGRRCRPLYLKLHAYVRMKLHEKYGDLVPANGPIPAYLLGNIWAQDWTNVYPLVAPANADPGYSLTDILKKRNMSRPRHGAHRRALLHVARLRAAAEDVLGAVAVRAAERSRGRVPRERVGHRPRRTMCASRCASSRRPKTSRPSITSSATTSTSAPTRRSRSSSATAPTTDSTKPSATPSRCRSRRNTS